MKCVYQYNGKTIDQRNLVKEFNKSTRVLKNAAIFSQEEIQESTERTLRALQGKKTEYQALDRIPARDFAEKLQPDFFRNIEEERDRLSLEYIKINRIKNFIDKESTEKPYPNLSKIPPVNEGDFQTVMSLYTDAGATIDPEVVRYYLSKMEDIMETEKITNFLGIGIHELVSLNILGKRHDFSYKKRMEDLMILSKEAGLYGTSEPEVFEERINKVVSDIVTNVSSHGKPITELLLVSDDNSNALISGRLDLITVDSEGTPHIYEIKISKHAYSDWDSAKLRALDWQLALYRQLVGQHVNVDKTQLYVIPIEFGEIGNIKSFRVGTAKSRTTENAQELRDSGPITVLARKLIPDRIVIDYDPTRELGLKNDLQEILPGSEVKTSSKPRTTEEIVALAEKRGRGKTWSWYNEEAIPGFPEGSIKAETKEQFITVINSYVAAIKNQGNVEVSHLRKLIIAAIAGNHRISLGANLSRQKIAQQQSLNNNFKEFLNGGWEVVSKFNEAEALGIIVLKNNISRRLALIDLTAHTLEARSNIEGLNYGNVEEIKTLYFLSTFKEDLLKSHLLSNIIIYDYENSKVHSYPDVEEMYDRYEKYMRKINKWDSNKLIKEKDIQARQDRTLNTIMVALSTLSATEKEDLDDIFENVDFVDATFETLVNLQKKLFIQHPALAQKSLSKDVLSTTSTTEYIAALLDSAIIASQGITPKEDYKGISTFALTFGNFKSVFSPLFTDRQGSYDKKGGKIEGFLVGGYALSPQDWVPSKFIRTLNLVVAQGNQWIRDLMMKQSAKIHKVTVKFREDSHYTKFDSNVIGNSQKIYKPLFRQVGEKVTEEFKLKNPYVDDLANSMEEFQKNAAKHYLFEINKYMLHLTTDEMNAVNPEKYETLLANPKIRKALENDTYFDMPLIRREDLTKRGPMLEAFKEDGLAGIWKSVTKVKNEIYDAFDTRGLLEGDVDRLNKETLGYYEMYDVYGGQTPSYKRRAIAEYGAEYFEFNLDTIAHRVAFNSIRKTNMDAVLPIIVSGVGTMKLLASGSNVNLDKAIGYIVDALKQAVLNEPIIGDEWKDIITATAGWKRFTTFSMLAFRPVLTAKELTLGLMKGVGIAAYKIYGGKDQFGVADLTVALKKLGSIDNKTSEEFNLITTMSQALGITNTDVNDLARILQSDRRGVLRGFGRWMYMTSTIGDYYNRMSLLIAKMLHDGSYDAHSLGPDGQFLYDATKDARFSYYLENRSKYKQGENYIPAKDDVKYNTQRRLYLLTMDQINQESRNRPEWKNLVEENMLPSAYSGTEVASFKSFTDMCYGYYDKASQATLNNMAVGKIFLQFMNFWPGKMQQWFSKPRTGEDSPFGKQTQGYTLSETGEKILLWNKVVYSVDDPDVALRLEQVTENTGDPFMIWEGTPHEGLIHSLLGTIREALGGTFKRGFKYDFSNKEVGITSEQRTAHFKFALHDTLLMLLIFGILKGVFDAWIDENGTDGIDGSVISFMSSVDKKVLTEANLYKSTIGAVSTTPAFFGFSTRLAADMQSTLMGNMSVRNLLATNTLMFEPFKEPI